MQQSSPLAMAMVCTSVLLAGCKEPLFSLHYDLPVDDSRLNFLKAFRSGINDTISRQGLDPEDFTLEDIEGSTVVRVSGSVSPEDATTLETVFRSRLARRPAEPLTLTIGLDDSLQSPEDGEIASRRSGRNSRSHSA